LGPPELVAEITYLGWTDEPLLRHTVFYICGGGGDILGAGLGTPRSKAVALLFPTAADDVLVDRHDKEVAIFAHNAARVPGLIRKVMHWL
jgi:hypothetical protein